MKKNLIDLLKMCSSGSIRKILCDVVGLSCSQVFSLRFFRGVSSGITSALGLLVLTSRLVGLIRKVISPTPQVKQGFGLSSNHLLSSLRTCTLPQ